MTETLMLTPKESLTIVSSTPEVIAVEAKYGPAGKPPPPHLHPVQDEHFEVIAGSVRAKVGGEERMLSAGEAIDIPRGTVHQMWNPGEQPARVRWETRPAGRTEQWFRAIDALHREGRVGKDGMPGPLASGVLLSAYRDTFRLAVAPDVMLRPALAALGLIGRLRGYRA
jgi:mannose-6-phosphate isomerase-like protein (cupin superfamily)